MSNDTTEPIQTKVCTQCGEHKSRTEFYSDKSRRDGLRYECRACRDAHVTIWRAENPETYRESNRKWREDNPEKERESNRKYRERNREKLRERNRKHYEENPAKARIKNRRRRARKANAEGTYTTADMRRQYKVQKGLCWWCLKPVAWEDKHDDHLIPLTKGGTDWPNNIVVSCAHCNCSKNNKMPAEFAGRLF